MSAATAGHPADPGAASNPYEKLYHYDDDDYYDPHCFFSSGLAQNRKRLGFIATCSTVQCKDAGSAGYDPLLPFKEDLAEWLYKMIRAEIQPNRFFPELQSGVHLCKLGIHMQRMAVKYRREHPDDTSLVPSKPPSLKYANATRKSPPFYCRDNISNFLDWSIEFGVKHSCRFETDDLTLRKNDRQIVIHLMEVGRLGVKFGIEPPTLIKLEMSLEDPMPAPPKGASTLDEKVQACAAECNCSIPFTVNRVSEGRYKVGEGRSIVFVRVLRSHVMVRVGGGWETLSAYFSKMDPCRAPMDSFGGKSPTGKLKQRFESNEEEQPAPRREPAPQREPEREVEEDSAPAPVVSETYAPVPAAVPPAKPKRPATSPSPAAIAATTDPIRKATPPRTRSPTKSPLRPSASTPAPRPASPKKTPVRASPSVSRESLTSPTPRPASIREPIITPRQTKASLLRTSSPSAIKTPSPANPLSPTGSGPGGISHPPWKNVPGSRSNLTRSASTPQRPASRTSGEAGPSTPNFQQPNRASTLDRKEPPTQNKRLIPVGGKNLPKSDQYNRATQRVSGKPKITSPELIRRAMEIMKDNGEVEDEEKVVRSPTDPALIAAIEEIAEEQYQCEAGEAVDVDVPENIPEPSVPVPEPSVTDLAPDSGVDTLAESKPAKVTENATVGDSSVPHLSGGDTLQDISDMITDDQDRSEMDQLEELPSDDAGFDGQDIPSQELVIEPIGLYYEDDATEEFEPTIEAGSVTEVASEAPLPFEPISEPEAEPKPEAESQVTDPKAEPQAVEAETQPETEPLAGASAEPADSDYEGGTTEDELNEAVGADNYASKMGEARHDSLSSANSGQGKDIPVDGPQRNGNVFVAVTISSQYPAEHRLAVTHEVEVDISKDGEKETTVEFLDPSELLGSITERHEPEEGEEEEAEEVTALLPATEEIEEEKIEEEELEEEDLVEQGQDDEEEEQWGDESDEVEEAEDAEKHIYVANVESGYDVSEQLQAMNEVELAISEGEELEDEPTPVITESMIKIMEEYMRATSEVEDSIEEFEKNVEAEAVDEAQEEYGEVLEVDNVNNPEEESIEEPNAEVDNVDNLKEEPERKLKAEVENLDDLEEEPFKELKTEMNKVDDIEEEPVVEYIVEANKVDNLEEEPVEESIVEAKKVDNLEEEPVEEPKVDNIEKEQAASLLEVTRRLEVLESITKRQLQLESAKEDLEESIKEFQRTTSKSDDDREPVLEVVNLEPVDEESAAETLPAAVSEVITVVEALPGPIMIEEGSASSGTASPPTVIAEKVEPETSSFAEKVKRLEHMIKKHPMKVPRPSDESDQGVVEVDNIAVKDIFTELPTVLMEEIQPVKSTVSNIEKKEKEGSNDLPPPLKPLGDQYEDFEPSKLEDVLAESMEHIPAPIDETFLVEEVIEVKPMAEELVVKLSEAQKEPVAEETIVVPAKVPIAPVEAEKTVVEAEDQPELQHVKMSKPPEKVEEVVVKEQFKEPSPPSKAIEVEPKDDLEIEDLEVIQEAEADEEGAIAEHPLSEGEEVVMKPEKTPLPNNSTLNLAPRRYSFEAEKSEEEKEGPARSSKRSMNSSGHTSDSDRSTSSEKGVSDTSSGYHEDYETSDGDELGTSYDKVPDVIMEQDQHTRSILKGSVRESTDSGIASGKQSLSSTPSLPTKQRMKSEDDEVFEEERAKGLNLPTEGHVREAVFTKAIESAINPLAWGIQIPNMGELQSASIVLPSKKAIRKASDGEYDYHGRRNNLQKVISKPHTEKTDMEWDERDQARHQDKMDGQTRDEKVHKWSGTLRSSQKKKKPFRTKKYDEDDILNAISQQATAVRAKNTCPVHAAGPPVTGPPKRRAQRPGTAPARKSTPTSRPATARPTYAAAAASKPKTTNVKAAKVETRRPSSGGVPASKPEARGSKAIAVKPASRTSNPQEVKSLSTGPKSGPMTSGASKPVLQTTKSTPIRRTGSLREGERAPLKLSNSLPRDKIRHGPKCTDLP